MTAPSIRVAGLWKNYVISAQSHNLTFRELIVEGVAASFRRRRKGRSAASPPEQFCALRDISFEVPVGQVMGVIGRNGAGKSTLLKILSRITEPTHGRVEVRGRVSSLLEVGTGFHGELTGRENIFLNGAILGMRRAEILSKLDEIVEFSGVDKFLDTPVKRYSSGMTVRLAFAVAAHLEPEILVVDEVLAVGDAEFQKKCLGRMDRFAEQGRTVIFVSHNLEAVRSLCSRAIVLNAGAIAFDGTAQQGIDVYLARMAGRSAVGHVIELRTEPNPDSFAILRIEVLDKDLNPLPTLRTWDTVVFRVVFFCPIKVEAGCVVLQVSTINGTVLLLFTTRPDRTVRTPFGRGEHYIDCRIANFPLAAGTYHIGAGLAIPNVEWFCRELDAAALEVHVNDLYGSGLPPRVDRYHVVTEHSWGPLIRTAPASSPGG